MSTINIIDLIINGMTIATFITVLTVVIKFSRWTANIEEKINSVTQSTSKAHNRLDLHLENHG